MDGMDTLDPGGSAELDGPKPCHLEDHCDTCLCWFVQSQRQGFSFRLKYPDKQTVHSSSGLALAGWVRCARLARPFVVKHVLYATWTTSPRALGWTSEGDTRYPQDHPERSARCQRRGFVRRAAGLNNLPTEQEPSNPES